MLAPFPAPPASAFYPLRYAKTPKLENYCSA